MARTPAGPKMERESTPATTESHRPPIALRSVAAKQQRAQAAQQIHRSMKAWRERGSEGGDDTGVGVKIPKGAGAPLPGAVKRNMEQKLGEDLSDVAVHTGGDSATAADGLNARAFTTGRDVHFGAGQFDPSSKEGTKLLAHELTHVVQAKRGGGVARSAEESEASEQGDAGPVAEHQGEPVAVSDPNEPAEQEADEVADAVTAEAETAEEESPQVHAPSPSVAAKLKGVGRKVFRSAKDDDDSETLEAFPPIESLPPSGGSDSEAAETRGYQVQTPSGQMALAEAEMTAFVEEVARLILGDALAHQDAVKELRSRAEQYEAKYTTGWRGAGLGLLAQAPPEIDLNVFDEACAYAANFVDALESAECLDGLNAADACGKNAYAQRDRAVAELKRWEEMDGITISAVTSNVQDKAGIAALALAVGSVTSAVVTLAGPTVPAVVIASKIVGAAAGAAVGGAATEANRQMARGTSPAQVDGGKVMKEAIFQAAPNAVWGFLGGTLLASQLVARLPKELVSTLGQKATELVGSIGSSLVGLVPLGRAAELLRNKPDLAPYDPNEIATEAADCADLPQLTDELEKRAPASGDDPATAREPTPTPTPNAPTDGEPGDDEAPSAETSGEEQDPEPSTSAPDEETT